MTTINSYNELLLTGQFSTEANCAQYLLDKKILPTHKRCSCGRPMNIVPCSTSRYQIGSCWECDDCKLTLSLRNASCLQNCNLSFRSFIDLLDKFSTNTTITDAAAQLHISQAAVRRVYKMLREQIAAAVQTTPMIGGPGTVVEVDEAKFGRRKYQRGRTVNGSWVCGGVQRNSDNCFLTPCTGNKRNAGVLSGIIRGHVLPGTTIITDKWKGYVNLSQDGYIHFDVNHSRNFVDPVTGAHTNSVEGMWTHAKHKTMRRGGRRSEDSLALDLTEFMWRKQRGLLRGNDRYRKVFSEEIPKILKYRNF